MRSLLLVLAVLIGCGSPSSRGLDPVQNLSQPDSILREVAAPGVAIHRWCDEHNEHHLLGSGVVLGWHRGHLLVVTAKHVVEEVEPGDWDLVPSLGGPGWTAQVVARSALDVAILAGVPRQVDLAPPAAALALNRMHLFERVLSYGHPLGMTRGHLTEGLVSNETSTYVVSSAPIFFGNSGGGLFVQDGGQWSLLGITVQIASRGNALVPHLAFSVHVRVVRDLLPIARSAVDALEVK